MHLTAMEIFTTACSYISQTVEDSEDIIGFAPAWLNVLLAECLETENTLRRMDGQAELEEAPRVSGETMSMEIPYHDALTRIALPYGLASDVYRDADDNYRVKKFRDLYIAALEEAVRGEGETVVDAYAGSGQRMKYEKAEEYGLGRIYAEMLRYADTNNSGTLNKDELRAYLDSTGLNRAQKAVLFELASTAKNPYE